MLKRLVCSIILFVFAATASFGQQEPAEYQDLECKMLNEDDPFRVVVQSLVVKLEDKSEYPTFWNEILLHYPRIKKDTLPVSSGDVEFFEYTYIFSKRTQDKLKVNLSSAEVISSPLSDIIQDFYIEFAADQKTVEVKFISFGEPKKITSPLNVAMWHEAYGRWSIAQVGSCNLYLPANMPYIRNEITSSFRKSQ